MKNNIRLIITLLVIVAVSWIELEFYSEAANVAETERKMAHIAALFAVQVVGYIGWYNNPAKWLKSVWFISYAVILTLILAVGAIEWKFDIFSTSFLDEIRNIRTFFSSPVPFLIGWVSTIISKNLKQVNANQDLASNNKQ